MTRRRRWRGSDRNAMGTDQRRMASLLAVFALLALVSLAARWLGLDGRPTGTPRDGVWSGTARVIDGDSLVVDGTEVRLKGIDAPEGRQSCQRDGRDWPCGEDARRALQQLIAGQKVECRAPEVDQHGRNLAFCTAGSRELNREMVRVGFALSYPSFGSEEAEAKAARRGLWSGTFQRPRDWRHDHGIGR